MTHVSHFHKSFFLFFEMIDLMVVRWIGLIGGIRVQGNKKALTSIRYQGFEKFLIFLRGF